MMKTIKLIILCCLVSLISCRKDDILPTPIEKSEIDIFTQKDFEVSDGEQIMFILPTDSAYVLKLVDKSNNQVISKEKIKGIVGANKIKIHTKSLQTKYLYIVLEDSKKTEINKTTIIVK